ncbi:uncharacterized protein LOC111498450 isoform X1 [Cucurbita maxima]|uniref:Uncharacterized protein LOC111498450 isoform X1 n=1 Tax=Cucurbita maxima TaxID=3661 RepID=A0A6J1KZA1_CUCMA|nr:uncharacterized protein LOC111498450 isoform X1 [Cucurbita maxima]XP_023005474.1 uncharacterized protein LOC111498450 isoform X1 [Cucurbita maxima]
MHRRSRGGGEAFFDFDDPFAGFGGFPGQRSLISDFFGGRDPFDDPFFRSPFGSMFESSFFGGSGIPFANMHASGFLDHQPPEPKRPRGLIIEEINSDDEKEAEKESKNTKSSSKEPIVEGPDDEEKGNQHLQLVDHHSRPNQRHVRPQANSFTFQSSSVTYGSSNGTYYTSSRTRRAGSDGVVFEESKEADTATRQATHKVSRGLHNKGHSFTRKLNPDGKVNTMQTLHNLNGDELESFENAWARNSRSLPGWPGCSNGFDNIAGGMGLNGQTNQGGLAVLSAQHPQVAGRTAGEGSSNPRSSRAQQANRSRKDARYMSA